MYKRQVAAGVLYPAFGILLSPMVAALAMSLSSVSVVANAVNRFLVAAYRPVINVVLRHRMATVMFALVALFASLWPASRLGSEFMPTLNEGTLLYMPASLPGMSVTKASELLQQQDRIIKGFPEVESVFGKAGRALTATDPAPLEMFETVINLKPEDEWRDGMTTDKLIAEMDAALKFPGVANSWTMPIKARTDMLATGIRTPVGIKLFVWRSCSRMPANGWIGPCRRGSTAAADHWCFHSNRAAKGFSDRRSRLGCRSPR